MKDKFGLNVCGEGGEYETLTLDCDLYKKRIVIDNAHVESIQDDGITEVALYVIDKCHCQPKVTSQADHKITLDLQDSDQLPEDVVLAPPKYKKVGNTYIYQAFALKIAMLWQKKQELSWLR